MTIKLYTNSKKYQSGKGTLTEVADWQVETVVPTVQIAPLTDVASNNIQNPK